MTDYDALRLAIDAVRHDRRLERQALQRPLQAQLQALLDRLEGRHQVVRFAWLDVGLFEIDGQRVNLPPMAGALAFLVLAGHQARVEPIRPGYVFSRSTNPQRNARQALDRAAAAAMPYSPALALAIGAFGTHAGRLKPKRPLPVIVECRSPALSVKVE